MRNLKLFLCLIGSLLALPAFPCGNYLVNNGCKIVVFNNGTTAVNNVGVWTSWNQPLGTWSTAWGQLNTLNLSAGGSGSDSTYGVSVDGSAGTYNTYGGNPYCSQGILVTWNSGQSNIWVDATAFWNSPGQYEVDVYLSGEPCTSNYVVTSVCPHTGYVPVISFSNGQTFNANYLFASDSSGNGYIDSYTAGNVIQYSYPNMPCGLTWTVTWKFCDYCEGAGDNGVYTTNGVTTGGSLATNGVAVNLPQVNNQTNAPLAVVPPDVSSNVLWSAPSSASGATTADLHDLGNGLNNTLWTADQQAHSDDSAIVGAINAARAQAHGDAQGINQNLGGFRDQNHADLQAINRTLQNLQITNPGSGSAPLTNYALNSTVASLMATNAAGFQLLSTNGFGLTGSMSNLASQIGSLTAGLSNVTSFSNLDFATEGTQQGISNTLSGISNLLAGTNGISMDLTNYAKESTLDVVTQELAGIYSNSFGWGTNGWTNGLTLQQLTNQAAAYTAQLSNSEAGALAQMSALTNQAGVMGMDSVVSAVQGLPGTVEYAGPGGVSPQVITLASGVSFSLGSNLPSYGPLRQVLAWATIVGLFLWNWRTTYARIRDVFTANQARTSGTEILGSNVNLSSALLMAVAIFAAATAIPTFAVAVLSNEVTLFFSVGSPSAMFSGFGWGYSFLDQYIPLATVISAVTSRVVFTVAIDSIAAVVMGIKLFLVGL